MSASENESSEDCVRAHLKIYGIVQGVFFRSNMRDLAVSLGVKGWVRNLPDGSVEAVAEGPEEAVEELVRWARKGPPSAVVDRIEVRYSKCERKYRGFRIKYLWW